MLGRYKTLLLQNATKKDGQHDRTQTWDFNFDCACSHGGCDMVSKNILMCFENWLIRGGFKGKRTQISVQYFNAKERLEMDYTGRMNKPIERNVS